MKNRVNQTYEDYWNYTAAFTDFDGDKFRDTLACVVNFIDAHIDEDYSADKYNAVQMALQAEVPCRAARLVNALPSQRKRLNQLVKLGFIRPFLKGYAPEAIDFLNAATDRRRQSVLSKVVYKYANLLNAMTNDIQTRQLTFFIKSLEEVGSISDMDLATLMTIDIEEFGKEYATRDDISRQYQDVDIEGFVSRKYNQVGHLKNLLGKLDDLAVHDGSIYFKTDADRLFSDEAQKSAVRDPYLQRVYKYELEEESCLHFGSEVPKCMLDGLSHPVLIASHIKPYSHCKEGDVAQFDVNNGLLLNKAFDSLFDLGYITFGDDGAIIASEALDADLQSYLSGYRLDEGFLNPGRLAYMEYHRRNVFGKRFAANRRRYNPG